MNKGEKMWNICRIYNFASSSNGISVLGTVQDITTITDFFDDTLNWEVKQRTDLTKEELEEFLKEQQDKVRTQYKKYYCLMVVIMSHGDRVSSIIIQNYLSSIW